MSSVYTVSLKHWPAASSDTTSKDPQLGYKRYYTNIFSITTTSRGPFTAKILSINVPVEFKIALGYSRTLMVRRHFNGL